MMNEKWYVDFIVRKFVLNNFQFFSFIYFKIFFILCILLSNIIYIEFNAMKSYIYDSYF